MWGADGYGVEGLATMTSVGTGIRCHAGDDCEEEEDGEKAKDEWDEEKDPSPIVMA